MKSCLFVGIDTHKNTHTAAILDDYFSVIDTITFPNSYSGFDKFMGKLSKISEGRHIIFGLEDSQGLGFFLAEYLIRKGFNIVNVNPVYTDRGRRSTVYRDKSDTKDAILIAKALIREKDNLHPVKIDKNSLEIREMVRYRQMLVEESTRIKNRLHNLLFNQYMEIISIFSNLFGKAALAFFSKYPKPLPFKGGR